MKVLTADCIRRINCATFSEDSTLMAAGFGESYIRLWNLKKEKLKGMRSDFSVNNITDGESSCPLCLHPAVSID